MRDAMAINNNNKKFNIDYTFIWGPHLKKYYEVIHDLGYVKKTLTKDFKLEERKTVFQNSFTNEQKNSRFFTITRNQILEIEDTTPDLDNPFEI